MMSCADSGLNRTEFDQNNREYADVPGLSSQSPAGAVNSALDAAFWQVCVTISRSFSVKNVGINCP
jgi:hypothetical protein